MFTSIDMAAKSLETQIKRFKGKLTAHHPRKVGRTLKSAETIIRADSVGSEGGINILEQVPHEVVDLSVEEAIIAMEDQDRDFLLFNNPESGKLSFVYRRSDGHYGVIDSLD